MPSLETQMEQHTSHAEFEVRFESLSCERSSLSFPCDGDGRLDLDHASERLRNNYLFARALVGRDFARPTVRRIRLH